MDPRDWQATEWSAFGQVGALFVAVIAGILVWRQVRHTAQAREDQTRPYVIVDFEFQGWEVLLATQHRHDPSDECSDHIRQALDAPHIDDPDELAVFRDGIPMLAPGRLIAVPFGNGPSFFAENTDEHFPLRYVARVEYSGHGGRKRYRDADLVLDLMPYKHTLVARDDLHKISQHLKDVKGLMKSWTSDRRLRVNTITQGDVDERHREWLEDQAARRAARDAAEDSGESTSSE